jgi:L-fucose isomerase-like protein
MNQNQQPLLGLCPIGKFVFSHEDALRQKAALQTRLRDWGVRWVDLDGVVPDGIVRDQSHVAPVVAHFRRQGIDSLFMPHCNFGTEGAVGMIGRQLALPTLIWGPRDDAPLPDGTRLRDTLCGMFASTKVLRKLGVPFSYIENCRLEDPAFRKGLDTFYRAAHAANALRRGMRIGLVGQRIDFFWSTIANESELLERFHVEVLPIDLVTFIENVRQRVAANHAAYADEATGLARQIVIEKYADHEPLIRVLAVRDQLLAHVADQGLDAIAMQDFMSLVESLGTWCLYASSLVGEAVPVAMESDLHGAISCVLLQRAAASGPVFLAEYTARHPTDDNGVLLWHAGAPTTLCKPGASVTLSDHWILKGPLAGMTHFPLRDGPITVARFDGDSGRYRLAVGEGVSMPGPFTQNNYVWMKVDHWPRWERTLMEGPWIHHTAMAYSHCAEVLTEMCRFVPQIDAVRLDEMAR